MPEMLIGGEWREATAHELRVGRHGQDPPHALEIARRHVLDALDQLAGGQVLLHLLLGPRREIFNQNV